MFTSKGGNRHGPDGIAYEEGRQYARDYWPCPCFRCLQRLFRYGERFTYFFRQGFYDQAKQDNPLDALDRATTCPACAIHSITGSQR